jgi:hypothetical protein
MSTIKSDNSNLILNADGAGSEVKFHTNGTTAMTIQNDGSLLVGTTDGGSSGAGDIVASAIFLGGNQAANELDDYEEGTWTPVLIDSSGTTITSTHANTRGRYEKIGRLVHIQLQIFAFATTGNGSLKFIEGLPYTSTNQMRSYARFASYAKPASSGVTDENFWVNAPSSKLSVWNSRDNSTYTDTTSIDANSEFFISISYSVS